MMSAPWLLCLMGKLGEKAVTLLKGVVRPPDTDVNECCERYSTSKRSCHKSMRPKVY
jgi:hypothetical protein